MMQFHKSDTALVVIDPQNDVLTTDVAVNSMQ
jgi:hypothetical protein